MLAPHGAQDGDVAALVLHQHDEAEMMFIAATRMIIGEG